MKKRKLDINWKEVMGNHGVEEEELPELEIVGKAKVPVAAAANLSAALSADDQMDCEQSLSDRGLEDRLKRQRSLLEKMGPKLHDKGEKIRAKIKLLEEEKQRRMLRRPIMDLDGCENLTHSRSSGSSDVSKQRNTGLKAIFRQGNTGWKDVCQATFTACFSKKPEETDDQSVKPFEKELQILGCERWKHKANGETLQRRSGGGWSPSRLDQFQHSPDGFKNTLSNGDRKSKVSSPYSLLDEDNDFNVHDNPRKHNLQESPSQNTRRRKRLRQTVINVDEEEPHPVTVAELAAELPEGMKEDICYPSRDDPEFVQVSRKDIECLSPEGYLTSPIMNFYIRYLQQQASSSNRASADCHFFNTYFYKKLKEAVSYKGNDKDAFFVKFRRWWKGTDLFRKAYILIPIHEDVHWSLVIICIPDKEDDSGLVILHLDSLGIHSRRSIADTVKRFLKEEWNYLNQDASSSEVPISEKVWRHLPRRITEAEIEVPQQKNDYDCGLFVLFFMERFVEEAPTRLKKKDLEMFDKKWFRPEQASALRVKIRKTLINLFRSTDEKTQISDNSTSLS